MASYPDFSGTFSLHSFSSLALGVNHACSQGCTGEKPSLLFSRFYKYFHSILDLENFLFIEQVLFFIYLFFVADCKFLLNYKYNKMRHFFYD